MEDKQYPLKITYPIIVKEADWTDDGEPIEWRLSDSNDIYICGQMKKNQADYVCELFNRCKPDQQQNDVYGNDCAKCGNQQPLCRCKFYEKRNQAMSEDKRCHFCKRELGENELYYHNKGSDIIWGTCCNLQKIEAIQPDQQQNDVEAVKPIGELGKKGFDYYFCHGDRYLGEVYSQKTVDQLQEKIATLEAMNKNQADTIASLLVPKDKIILTSGDIAIVDSEDYPHLIKYKWSVMNQRGRKYAKANIEGSPIPMHQFILGTSNGMLIDHIDGNSLNNKKENLRYCTNSENQCNRGAVYNNSTGYKGVSWHKTNKKYTAQIKKDGKYYHLGSFDCKHRAAFAYNEKATEIHGQFAYLNDIPDDCLDTIRKETPNADKS